MIITMALLLSVLLVSNVHVNTVQAYSQEGGIINSNTAWTKSNGPYTLTGPVGIAEGATLTIEPGVTINLGPYTLEVNGSLIAQGTPTDKIVFNSDAQNMQPALNINLPYGNPTCKIENAVLYRTTILAQSYYSNASVSINNCSFEGNAGINIWGSTTISNSYITGGVSLRGSSVVSNSKMLNGIDISGSYTLSGNTITNLQGIWVIDAGEAGSSTLTGKIIDNIIYGGGTAGINLAAPATIQGNLIIDNQIGISIRSKQDNSLISHNMITGNQVGVRTPTSATVISNNNIGNNTDYNLSVGNVAVDVTNNWWGTTDTSVIDNKILDNSDDFNLGKVNYAPFLTAPDSQAPSNTYIPIATPSPSSTAPSTSPTNGQNFSASPDQSGPQTVAFLGLDWMQIATLALLVVIAVLLVIVVVFLRKKRKINPIQIGSSLIFS